MTYRTMSARVVAERYDVVCTYPDNLNRSQGEHRKTTGVLESQTDQQRASLSDVLGQQVQNELLTKGKGVSKCLRQIKG